MSLFVWPGTNIGVLPLPTGAATAAKQDTGNASLATIAGKDFATAAKQDTGNSTLTSILNALNAPVSVERTVAHPAIVRDYSTANISDAAWTEIIASTTAKATLVKIFDSSGEIIRVATGAGGAETDLIRIPPGGDNFEILVPINTRIAIRAETGTGTISTGKLVFQMFT